MYQTAAKNLLASTYASNLGFIGALTALGTSGAVGPEPSGGSPAYTRKTALWGTASGGAVVSAQVVLDIPTGVTIQGVGLFDRVSGAPTYYDQVASTPFSFSSQGTFTVTATFSQG